MKKFFYSMVGSLVLGNGGADYAGQRIFLQSNAGKKKETPEA
jgi:hypothetical protein